MKLEKYERQSREIKNIKIEKISLITHGKSMAPKIKVTTCLICNRDLSRWNLDFYRHIICNHCVVGLMRNLKRRFKLLTKSL